MKPTNKYRFDNGYFLPLSARLWGYLILLAGIIMASHYVIWAIIPFVLSVIILFSRDILWVDLSSKKARHGLHLFGLGLCSWKDISQFELVEIQKGTQTISGGSPMNNLPYFPTFFNTTAGAYYVYKVYLLKPNVKRKLFQYFRDPEKAIQFGSTLANGLGIPCYDKINGTVIEPTSMPHPTIAEMQEN